MTYQKVTYYFRDYWSLRIISPKLATLQELHKALSASFQATDLSACEQRSLAFAEASGRKANLNSGQTVIYWPNRLQAKGHQFRSSPNRAREREKFCTHILAAGKASAASPSPEAAGRLREEAAKRRAPTVKCILKATTTVSTRNFHLLHPKKRALKLRFLLAIKQSNCDLPAYCFPASSTRVSEFCFQVC